MPYLCNPLSPPVRAHRVPSCPPVPRHQASLSPYLLHQLRELRRRLHRFVLSRSASLPPDPLHPHKRDPSSPSPPLLPQRCAAPPRYKRDPSPPPPSPSVPPLPTRCPRLESRLAQQQPSPILLYMALSRSVFLFVDVGPPVLASSPLSLRFRKKQAFASLSVCCVLDREGSSSCVIWWQPVVQLA